MTYDEWFKKVGAILWRDAKISTGDILRAAWSAATAAEREACAGLAGHEIGAAIRARGEQ